MHTPSGPHFGDVSPSLHGLNGACPFDLGTGCTRGFSSIQQSSSDLHGTGSNQWNTHPTSASQSQLGPASMGREKRWLAGSPFVSATHVP